jgi:hypothetical protein
MSSASSLFRRADGGVGVVSVLRSKASHNFLEINCLQVEFCMGHGCVIESSGTFPKGGIVRPPCAAFGGMRGAAQNCAILTLLNFAPCCRRPMTRVRGEGGLAERSAAESQPSPASPIIVETLGELLKFVVNSLLPIERLRQSITSLSRAVGMRLAAAEFSVDLGLEEEDSQGFGITPT